MVGARFTSEKAVFGGFMVDHTQFYDVISYNDCLLFPVVAFR
jgi:hypothetical protein